MSEKIPFNSLAGSTEADRMEIERAIRRVLDSGWYILGKETATFEEEFAAYLGGGHTVGVASGTDAIEVALRAVGVGPGDLVATVSLTAVGTVVGIERCGAEPVFVDIGPGSFTMDPVSLKRTLARYAHIRCVLPVHLYGQTAAMDQICELAGSVGAFVVEDCAQATGAKYRNSFAGTLGDAAAFSYYPTKNLGALGDGGAVFTKNPDIATRSREIRQYGWKQRYISSVRGLNSRLDEVQSAILRARLPSLDERNRRRNAIAARYSAAITAGCVVPPQVAESTSAHAYHQYVVRCADRDSLRTHLETDNIETGILYPAPIHQQPAYTGCLADPEGLMETEKACRELLCLPIFPELTDAEVARVTSSLERFCREHESGGRQTAASHLR